MKFALSLAILLAGATAAFAQEKAPLEGAYEIWEDVEGGRVCQVNLSGERTIGGYVLEGDLPCLQQLDLKGEPFAWLIDNEGWFVIIDATRRILVRFEPSTDGESFYSNRQADGLESLNMTLPLE